MSAVMDRGYNVNYVNGGGRGRSLPLSLSTPFPESSPRKVVDQDVTFLFTRFGLMRNCFDAGGLPASGSAFCRCMALASGLPTSALFHQC